jgi:hypothetical protein
MSEELSVMAANIGSPEQVQAANDYFAARDSRARAAR